ncbi:Peptide chain release factor 3 [Gossypium arboreum]|uniref:Peptide chain release factor 3 n=2 Tax=Gossypium TaxID=3633 RepID=A0A0B0NI33_GOSAR|nr:Peptide chain release factor 3 [Gossypium arboreum]TYH91725.1 hypothetical protein ES332_A13G133500v1 [Gossypium tomentosum]
MFLPNNLTTTVVSISLIKIFFKRSEKLMAGIPLIEDRRMSPSSIMRSPSEAPSPDSKPFLPRSISFQETSFTGVVSTTMLSIESSPTTLNLTFLVLRSSSVKVPISVRPSDGTLKTDASFMETLSLIFYANLIFE